MNETLILPVFVYGTLRSGLGNYQSILAGHTDAEVPASLSGVTMYDAGGCPFVSDRGTGTVVGEIMYLTPADVEETMVRLDRLEGFRDFNNPRNMYERTQVVVTVTDGPDAGTQVTVWTYLTAASTRDWTTSMRIVESGDWTNRRTLSPA